MLLSDQEKHDIRRTWRLVEQAALMQTATELFYKDLFTTHPAYRAQFPEDMSGQVAKLAKTWILLSSPWTGTVVTGRAGRQTPSRISSSS